MHKIFALGYTISMIAPVFFLSLVLTVPTYANAATAAEAADVSGAFGCKKTTQVRVCAGTECRIVTVCDESS